MAEAALNELFTQAASQPLCQAWSTIDELRRAPARNLERWLEKVLPLEDDDPLEKAAALALARLGLPAFFTAEKPPLARLYRRPAAQFMALVRAYYYEEWDNLENFLRRPSALRFLLLQFCDHTLLKQLASERNRKVRIFDPGRSLVRAADIALALFTDRGLSDELLVERLRSEYDQGDHSAIAQLRKRLRSPEFLAQLPESRMQFGTGERYQLNKVANIQDAEGRTLEHERLASKRERHDAWSFVKTDLNTVLEDLFFGNPRVCPRLEARVAHVDLMLREAGEWNPYDLKSTYLPPAFVDELRAEMALENEHALLRVCLTQEVAAGRLDKAVLKDLSTPNARRDIYRLVDKLAVTPRPLRELRRDLENYRASLICRLADGEEWLVRKLLSHLYANQGAQRFCNNARIIVVAATPTLTPNDVLLLADLKRLERAVGAFLDNERPPLEVSYEQRKGGLGVVHTTRAHLIFIS